ncbi:DNA glycosylase [Trichodelitschia bisporula]|uniref:DNA glycosylase n=1 Tax=Trichodelitschia bisporula TaxID=703511 RepID=A0A6G1HZD0_9PEZI|nr:DNA glycosylase [Trichodelitschia bisporula]
MARHRVIIDTDPGVDDVLALLLALSARAEDIEVLLVSVTFGNIDVQSALRNVIATFHLVGREMAWRKAQGREEGFGALRACKPLVAVGADAPLADPLVMAEYFHGIDGLGGVHTSHPHLAPPNGWQARFPQLQVQEATDTLPATTEPAGSSPPEELYTPSPLPAHRAILDILAANPPGTITILALAPQTTLAKAAAADPTTFMRAKEVVAMAGALGVPGNVTPVAEFNAFADPVAAARVLALTARDPARTMPPDVPGGLGPYQAGLKGRLDVVLFPLDITTPHVLLPTTFSALIAPSVAAGSPLATWVAAFMVALYKTIARLEGEGEGLGLHDPLVVGYLLPGVGEGIEVGPTDVRVETGGQWTRGMTVSDRRPRVREEGGEVVGDEGGWLGGLGNRVRVAVGSGVVESFGEGMVRRILGIEG